MFIKFGGRGGGGLWSVGHFFFYNQTGEEQNEFVENGSLLTHTHK